jgi:HPt (histidine-containing phosphotransfer) domain-containing protein
LNAFFKEELPAAACAMEEAFNNKEYDTIEKLAHKIKGGAVYLGVIRLKMACQYIERYYKTGERILFQKLYEQGKQVIEETIEVIKEYIEK